MGKLLPHRKARPGELFFGGKGVIIPMARPASIPVRTQNPSSGEPPPKQPEPLKSGDAD